mmetsp:Transcript_13391/g.40600  ORF Transcript_13391/g.40600 Transcript_13391/m.40600 type:complete len:201 (+) Transcript_13391:1160-1762(+)|eukprot:scaffold157810_cov36-Tisochrysis_lutea.AAC.2
MFAHSSALDCTSLTIPSSSGSTLLWISSAVATWIAEGKTSLVDCEALTWSLGWTATTTSSSRFRLTEPTSCFAIEAITSLTFMLLCVPEPEIQIGSGNWSSCSPATTCAAAALMRSARWSSSLPSELFAAAAACLIRAIACTSLMGIRSPSPARPSPKKCIARWVCALQSASALTSIGPMLSFSVRVLIVFGRGKGRGRE